MTSNRTSLAQVRQMTAKQVADLPTDHLSLVLEDLAALKADAKRLDDKLTEAMNIKFGDRAAEMRRADGKDTGRVSFEDGDYVIRADAPKKVVWDQASLMAALQVIREEWKEDPSHYVTTEVKVSETKYNAWPPAIRDLFTPARTVGTGKASFAIERRAA